MTHSLSEPRYGPGTGPGRRPTGLPPSTGVIRVPRKYLPYRDELINLWELVESWSHAEEKATSKNPRWDRFRRFLEEARAHGFEILED